MIYQQLGPSGLTVSVVGLGCNNFGARMADEDVPTVVGAAIDAGITLFDTADVYGNAGGSETLLGEALKGRRDEVVIATKFGMDMGGANGPDWGVRGSRRYIRLAVESSLRRLGHRLDRSLPAAPTRSAHPDRGDPGRAVGAGDRGQGPLHRLLEPDRLAGGRRRLDRPLGWLRGLHLGPERVQLAEPGRRDRARARPGAHRAGPAPVLPPGQGSADRQVPAGSGRAGRHQAGLAVRRAGVRRLRHRRGAPVVRRRARTDAAPDRDRRAGCDADGRFRDRRARRRCPRSRPTWRPGCGSRRPTTC